MEAEKLQAKLWSNAQAYAFAMICLLLGIVTGYLLRAPSQAAVRKPPARQDLPAGATGGMRVPPEQLTTADKKAEPLLAELQKHPNDVVLLTKIGKIYFYERQFTTSSVYIERAAKLKPDPETLASLAAIYHYAGDDNKAIESLNRALQIDPKFAGALFNLGMLKWESQSDPKAAISAWEKLLKANPDHPKRAEVEAMIARARKHMNMASAGNAVKPSKQLRDSNLDR